MSAEATPTLAPAWLRCISNPELVRMWALADWDSAIRLLRRHRLLARLAAAIERAGLMDAVPPQARIHLQSESVISASRVRAAMWVVDRLPETLSNPDYPLVLLKGAAYLAQESTLAAGRMPSDLDILVPKARLKEVSFLLAADGWREPPLDAHDRRYYLEWSHELPPLTHPRHGVELDVHHNILPPRRGHWVDADLLLAELQPTPRTPWRVLSARDQVIHSAAHLFFDSEPRGRLRDIVDLDGLLRGLGASGEAWESLRERALQLQLEEPVWLGCHFANAFFSTPIPASFMDGLVPEDHRRIHLRSLALLFRAVFMPLPLDERDHLSARLAARALLIRYHWHRLPLRDLVPHLVHKWKAGRASAGAAP